MSSAPGRVPRRAGPRTAASVARGDSRAHAVEFRPDVSMVDAGGADAASSAHFQGVGCRGDKGRMTDDGSGPHIRQTPRRTGQAQVADFTILVRVPGRPATVGGLHRDRRRRGHHLCGSTRGSCSPPATSAHRRHHGLGGNLEALHQPLRWTPRQRLNECDRIWFAS